jgi:dTDP-glucose 4,6-dehydratase
VNIGSPQEISVLDLATRIVELAGSRSPLGFIERPVDDPTTRCPDITLARTKLGWEPRVDRDDGLRDTIAWFARRTREQLPATAA